MAINDNPRRGREKKSRFVSAFKGQFSKSFSSAIGGNVKRQSGKLRGGISGG